MILLLLLGTCVCTGHSYDSHDEVEYGKTYRIRLNSKAHSVEFIPSYSSEVMILWKRDAREITEDSRRKMLGNYYVTDHVTQKDSGRYIVRDKDQRVQQMETIEVIETTVTYTLTSGERLHFSADLQSKSCNIYYFPEGEYEVEIVHQGRPKPSLNGLYCEGLNFVWPCEITNQDPQMSCSGRFEVRDQNGDMAMVVTLIMESNSFDPSYLGIGGIVLVLMLLYCCVGRCCGGKNSSEKDSPESAAAADDAAPAAAPPALRYHEYDREPVGPRSRQPSEPPGTRYPAQPAYSPTCPLIHNPPLDSLPPAYSEIFTPKEPADAPAEPANAPAEPADAPAEPAAAPAEPADAPAVPFRSDPELRFEVKGMKFNGAAPLSTDSPYCGVYTSDKLNFP